MASRLAAGDVELSCRVWTKALRAWGFKERGRRSGGEDTMWGGEGRVRLLSGVSQFRQEARPAAIHGSCESVRFPCQEGPVWLTGQALSPIHSCIRAPVQEDVVWHDERAHERHCRGYVLALQRGQREAAHDLGRWHASPAMRVEALQVRS